ncbi:MAG: hypothetical protein NVS3B28_25330 [Candidatus Velthaea sp.]
MSDLLGNGPSTDSLADFRRLADDLPWSIWTHRPDGTVDWANRAWYEFSRLPREVTTGPAGWAHVAHPDDYAELMRELRAALDAGTSLEIEVRLKPATADDEAYRWFFVRSTPRYDAGGKLTYRLGSAMDVHEVRTRGDEQARAFQTIADGIPEILWTAKSDGTIDWYNRRWFEYTGLTVEAASGWLWRSVVHPDDLEMVISRFQRSIDTGEPYEIDSRIRRADGVFRWFLSRALPLRDANGEIERWCGTSMDVDDARRASAREQLYARMTEEMSTTLSLQETLASATRLVVPEFADYALVNLIQDDGEPMCVAAFHRDPGAQPLVLSLIGRKYTLPNAGAGTQYTIATGRPTVYERVDAELWSTIRPEFIDTFERLGLESAIGVPLQYHGRTVGSLSAVMSRTARSFSADDFPLFAEIARRIAPAIGNAEAYERERRVAQSFQQAAMVRSLPSVPGLRFDAIYEAAHADATVGGDWYDAVRLPDGRVVLSIGDVAGSGLDAAVTMGSVRQSIRTAALINPEPALVLEAVDRIVRAMDADRFVTAFVALLDPMTFELRYAAAGHPPPLLRAPDGTISMLDAADLPLGLRQRDSTPTTTLLITPGSLLVAYTDGLTEFDRDPVAGELKLIAAARAALGQRPAHDIYSGITLGRPAHDDVAVLTIALDRTIMDADGGAHGIRWAFPSADGVAAAAARGTYAQRLRNLGIPEGDVVCAELIFAELVGNAYRYAPGEVEVVLDTSTSAPVVHVLDNGEGFEYRPRLPLDPLAERGRGLFLVRALSEEVSAEHRASGGSHVRVVLAARPRVSRGASLDRDALV